MKKNSLAVLALCLAVMMLAVGCGTKIKGLGGNPMGMYTDVLTDLFELWDDNGVSTDKAIGDSDKPVKTLEEMQKGGYNVGVLPSNYLTWARTRKGGMTGTANTATANAGALYSVYLHIIVRDDGQINSLEDLRDKRLVLNVGETGGFFHAKNVLKAAGINVDSGSSFRGKIQRSSYLDGMIRLGDNEADAVLTVADIGDQAIEQYLYDEECPLKLLPIDSATQAEIQRLSAAADIFYTPLTVENVGGYEDRAPVDMVVIKVALLVNTSVTNDTVRKMLEAIFDEENLAALKAGNPLFADLSLQYAVTGMDLRDLHPGALQFYVEKGVIPEGSVEIYSYLQATAAPG